MRIAAGSVYLRRSTGEGSLAAGYAGVGDLICLGVRSDGHPCAGAYEVIALQATTVELVDFGRTVPPGAVARALREREREASALLRARGLPLDVRIDMHLRSLVGIRPGMTRVAPRATRLAWSQLAEILGTSGSAISRWSARWQTDLRSHVATQRVLNLGLS